MVDLVTNIQRVLVVRDAVKFSRGGSVEEYVDGVLNRVSAEAVLNFGTRIPNFLVVESDSFFDLARRSPTYFQEEFTRSLGHQGSIVNAQAFCSIPYNNPEKVLGELIRKSRGNWDAVVEFRGERKDTYAGNWTSYKLVNPPSNVDVGRLLEGRCGFVDRRKEAGA